MNILFYLGHPAHFYLSKSLALKLKEKHKIIFVARAKDVLLELIKDCEFRTLIITKKERGSSKLNIICTVLKREFYLLWIYLKYKPDILLGTDIVITHIGKLFNKPSFIFNEDDEEIVPLLAKYGFKYSSGVISPKTCILTKNNNKKIEYDGFHKLAYLHPKYFTPNIQTLEKYNIETPFYIIRTSSLKAHHDKNKKGLSNNLISKIVANLGKIGKVYISSEGPIPENLIENKLQIKPSDMHQILYYADLLISDSQSMSVESALLGTYSIRFSDFTGKIGVLNELEYKYKLTKGFTIDNEEKVLFHINKSVLIEKSEIQKRRNIMLADKIDVTSFFVWFIENYPESKKIMDENPDYQYNFK